MYRFNSAYKWIEDMPTVFKYNKCIGSIQGANSDDMDDTEFKYNKCIGSMSQMRIILITGRYLNTTNVSVQCIMVLI